MTDLDIALPRPARESFLRLDHVVAEESYLPHVGWSRFVAVVLGGGYSYLGVVSWSCSIETLEPVLECAVTSTDADGRRSALLDFGTQSSDAWAYVSLANGHVRATVAAATETDLEEASCWLRERLPHAVAAESRVPVEFWARAAHGGEQYGRKIEVPAWAEIALNYPERTRHAVRELLDTPPLDGGGRLLLWHGPPGTGKTHVVRALAWEWRSWCDMHYVTDPEEFFGSAQYMLQVLLDEDGDDDRWRLLVLEDTGELLSADAKERTGQGLSRFLNVVDGIVGQGLRVLVLVTTNELLRHLHPAVSRPGRCAVAHEFGLFGSEEAAAWLARHGAEPVAKEATLAELYAIANGRPPEPPQSRRVGF